MMFLTAKQTPHFSTVTIKDCLFFYKKGLHPLCEDGCVVKFLAEDKDIR